MITLRPYQIEARDAVLSDWQQHQAVLGVASTGTGKTEIFLGVLDELIQRQQLGRALILVHRIDLAEQPRNRAAANWPGLPKIGIVQAEQNECREKIVAAMVQTLQSPGRLEQIIAAGPISHLIVDECFPSGTQVDGRPIETIAVGDTVSAYNAETNTFENRVVTHTFKRPAPSEMIRIFCEGTTLVCTPSHPVFANGTWVRADFLHIGDSMVQCTIESENSTDGKDHSVTMYRVWKRNNAARQAALHGTQRQGVLFARMFGQAQSTYIVGDNGGHQSQICQRTDDAQEPHEEPNRQRKDDLSREGTRLAGNVTTWRQRKIYSLTTTTTGLRTWMADRSSHQNKRQKIRVSAMLQSGHCKRDPKDCNRNRREVARNACQTGTRPKKNFLPRIVRVDRVEILKCSDQNISRSVCPDGFVYNLEVEGLNTYTANGIVVHNCHHTNASTYLEVIRKLQTAFPDLRILGVTATPRRTDGDGLRKVFTKNSFKLTIKDAIRLKALCPFTALAVELPPVTVRETASEDGWDQEEMGNALDYANVHAIVYNTWREQAADRQTMIFTAGVKQAHHLAEYFRDQGVLAEAVDGTTPKDQRARIRDNYLAGAVKVLVNCAVYTEGFDAPQTSCIAMVKPTKSDVVYIQAVGRGLRQAIGKSDCLILDFCPVGLHDMRLAGDLLGKPKKEKKAEQKAVEKGVILSAFAIDDEGNGIDGDVNEVKLRVLDMLGRHSLQWTLDKGVATTVISTEVSLAIVMPQDKRIAKATELRGKPGWTLGMEKVYQDIHRYQLYWVGKDHEVRSLGNFDDPDMARAAADDFAEDHRQNAVADKRGKWRKLEPSPAQVKFARALGVYRDGMTRGAACQAIAQETIMRQFRALRIVR